MSPRYDYRCIKCDRLRENVTVASWNDATHTHKETCDCGGEMRKLPAAPNFRVTGYNATNGYGVKHD